MAEQKTYDDAVKEFKRQFLSKAVVAERGVLVHAARRVGVHRNTMTRLMHEVGLSAIELRRHLREVGAQ